MATGKAPRTVPTFLKVGERKLEVVVISKLNWWLSHWDPEIPGTRRCGGAACYCCHVGQSRAVRYVVLVLDQSGEEHLVEFRERHRDLLEDEPELVGCRLSLKKAGSAKNAPVEVRIVGRQYVIERDISRLVESLGAPPILVQREGTSGREPEEPTPSRESVRSM